MIEKYEKFDAKELRKALFTIWSKFNIKDYSFGLTHRPNAKDPLMDSMGNKEDETVYTEFLEEAKSTYFYEVFGKINKDYQIVNRLRIVCLKPMNCYSVHRDHAYRFQIPIVPNEHSFLFVNENINQGGFKLDKETTGFTAYQMLEAGRIYGFDATYYHTYLNGHKDQDRIHLVIS